MDVFFGYDHTPSYLTLLSSIQSAKAARIPTKASRSTARPAFLGVRGSHFFIYLPRTEMSARKSRLSISPDRREKRGLFFSTFRRLIRVRYMTIDKAYPQLRSTFVYSPEIYKCHHLCGELIVRDCQAFTTCYFCWNKIIIPSSLCVMILLSSLHRRSLTI